MTPRATGGPGRGRVGGGRQPTTKFKAPPPSSGGGGGKKSTGCLTVVAVPAAFLAAMTLLAVGVGR